MWVRDARGGPGFAREARDDLIVGGQRRAQDFDGDHLIHQDVYAAIDRAHSALVDQLFDAVLTGERLADERVADFLQDRAVRRTQSVRILILSATLRTLLHRLVPPGCCAWIRL